MDGPQTTGYSLPGPDYVKELDSIVEFLRTPKYSAMLQAVANRERRSIDVSIDDLRGHFDMMPGAEDNLVDSILNNAHRYVELFSQAVDKELPETRTDLTEDDDVADVLAAHRIAQLNEARREAADNGQDIDPKNMLPAQLMRRFEVHFKPGVKTKFKPVREVSAPAIGSLVTVKAMVTRVSDVKPLVTVLTYTCDDCGNEVYQTVKGREFMPLTTCPGECTDNGSSGRLHMQTRGSRFVKFQEIKIQELPEQVPVGNIPRSMTCLARGEMCRRAGPGDIVTVTGIFLPTPYTGFQRISAGLVTDTYLDVQDLSRVKKTYAELELTEEMEEKIQDISRSDSFYDQLSSSLAPEIYGHVDIKKALLLQLVGGVTQTMADGMRIRGDINICLMGDPGVAKSQLLKHISSVAPRGVYTTGKGSSGVGLTAAVLRDPVTKELMLEGGALVMADKGICCIDEFDKMEDGDRTAIHEVMEQQTVSIAKAGITTTLNARTAILAAANPLYGRYNRRLTPTENINLPAALLSRFDLMFLILDKADADADMALANHVTYVHKHGEHPEVVGMQPFPPSLVRAYIAEARKLQPVVPEEVSTELVEAYVEMRKNEKMEAASNNEQTMMTARRLLSILRLSQGLARLRLANEVEASDVKEAIRLVHVSKASLLDDDSPTVREDAVSRIFTLMRDRAVKMNTTELEYDAMESMAAVQGFSSDKFKECIEQYAELNVIMVDSDLTTISFVEA